MRGRKITGFNKRNTSEYGREADKTGCLGVWLASDKNDQHAHALYA